MLQQRKEVHLFSTQLPRLQRSLVRARQCRKMCCGFGVRNEQSQITRTEEVSVGDCLIRKRGRAYSLRAKVGRKSAFSTELDEFTSRHHHRTLLVVEVFFHVRNVIFVVSCFFCSEIGVNELLHSVFAVVCESTAVYEEGPAVCVAVQSASLDTLENQGLAVRAGVGVGKW